MKNSHTWQASMAKPDLSIVCPLPLRVVHKPHETAYSLLCRLAARNGNKSVRHVLQRVPNMSGFVSNLSRELEVSLAALLSGSNRNKISESTPLYWGRSARLGNYQGLADASTFKICPLCFAEDVDSEQISDRDARPYVRDFWHFDAVKHCPIHGVTLVTNCGDCKSELSHKTLFGYLCTCGADVRSIRCQKAQRSEMSKSWDILRQMGWLYDIPYWQLGRDRYPSKIKWALTDINKIGYSKRQLMLMGPLLLRATSKKPSWDVDRLDFFRIAAKMLSIRARKQTEQRIGYHCPLRYS